MKIYHRIGICQAEAVEGVQQECSTFIATVYRDGTPNGSEGGPFLMEGGKRTVGVVGARAAMM